MIGLFDRDVFLKLGCCNLWDEAIAALGITQPYRLPSTTDERSNRKVVLRKLADVDPTDALMRIQAMVRNVPILPDEATDGITATAGFKLLSGVDGIDGGEHILAAILINEPKGKILLSGDKRFVDAFRDNRPDQWAEVAEAVISFEMCLLAVEERYGFDYLVERALPVKHCDGTLKLAFGQEPTAKVFREALQSYNPCRVVQQATASVDIFTDH